MEIKKTLKKLISDTVTFHGFTKEREQIKDLFVKTSIEGESNSALLISQKFGGKTTVSWDSLINPRLITISSL